MQNFFKQVFGGGEGGGKQNDRKMEKECETDKERTSCAVLAI